MRSMLTDYLHFKSIPLKTRAKALYWACTAIVFLPGLALAILALMLYHIPPKRFFRDNLGESLVRGIVRLGWWRDWQVRDYITYEKQGFRLIVE